MEAATAQVLQVSRFSAFSLGVQQPLSSSLRATLQGHELVGASACGVTGVDPRQNQADPLKGTLLNPTYGSLKRDLLRGSISPRVPPTRPPN